MEYCKMCQHLMDKKKDLEAQLAEVQEANEAWGESYNATRRREEDLKDKNAKLERVVDYLERWHIDRDDLLAAEEWATEQAEKEQD